MIGNRQVKGKSETTGDGHYTSLYFRWTNGEAFFVPGDVPPKLSVQMIRLNRESHIKN